MSINDNLMGYIARIVMFYVRNVESVMGGSPHPDGDEGARPLVHHRIP